MDWELEELKKFIQSELKKGYDPETVRSTLASSGFARSNINKAFASLGRKTIVIKPKRARGPGIFSGWFVKKKKAKPKKKVAPKPPKKIVKPKKLIGKKGPGLLTRFFFKEVKVKRPIKKAKPIKKVVKKPLPKPKRAKRPGLFTQLFKRRTKKQSFFGAQKSKAFLAKPKSIKPIVKPKPIIKPKRPRKPFFKLPKFKLPKIKPPKLPKIKLPKIFRSRETAAVTALIAFFVCVGLIIWAFPASCATESCFINKANKCQAATFANIVDGTTFKYEANNCILKKTVIKLAPDEPREIINEFIGKNMLCAYKEDDFSPLYVNTISGMINTCEGELKAAILKYVVP